MFSGWPLGLENMNIRLGVVDSLQAVGEQYSSRVRSASFSSFTSSELNTESTRSFFQDHSVSLGRLIGMKPKQGGDFYLKDSIHFEEYQQVSTQKASSNAIKRHEIAMSRGICIPLFLNVLVKINPSRNCSRG
ncbi:hypothetical protein BVC80_1183g33 [Macleaya cordata]|uniref:Uncharacterized protein n=1 Tax=Macleaya cordata TaxID=56857 RepID=A0A200PQ51_MACCD|nr:hypothetical protein BVC80_1183g33 [Macleaya cordata]